MWHSHQVWAPPYINNPKWNDAACTPSGMQDGRCLPTRQRQPAQHSVWHSTLHQGRAVGNSAKRASANKELHYVQRPVATRTPERAWSIMSAPPSSRSTSTPRSSSPRQVVCTPLLAAMAETGARAGPPPAAPPPPGRHQQGRGLLGQRGCLGLVPWCGTCDERTGTSGAEVWQPAASAWWRRGRPGTDEARGDEAVNTQAPSRARSAPGTTSRSGATSVPAVLSESVAVGSATG